MTTEQNELADELAAISGRCSIENDRTTIIRAVAALRAAGEPVAYRWRPQGAVAWVYDPEMSWFDAHRDQIEHEPLYAAQPAPSASVREALEQCIRICMEEASEWDSDRLQNYKNYAGHCANRISTEVLATPSPLMAAGEAAETAFTGMTFDTIEAAFGEYRKTLTVMDKPANFDSYSQGYVAGWDAKEAAARASETVEATSPAKRDYAARVMRVSVDPVESDQVRCGPMGEDDWKDQRIASLEAYIAQLKDQQAMAGPTQETGKAAEVAHPWYGPCDALAADGACAECIKVAAAEPTRATDANRAEALHGADLGRWCSEHPNLAAITIEALRGQMAEPTIARMTPWLIEWPQDDNVPVRWWNPSTGWMRDANKAMWLSRKSDAVDYISSHQFVTTVRPTEHQFLQAIRAIPAPSASVREDAAVADQIIGQIEDRFPGWRSYRDLIDCIDVTLHRLRAGARQ